MEEVSNVENVDSAPKFVPIEDLVAYAEQGLSLRKIGKLTGISPQAVSQHFQRAGYTPKRLRHYKQHRADIFAYYQTILLNSLTESEIKRIPPAQRIVCLGILYDKERLERGQSTSNTAVLSTVIARLEEHLPPPATPGQDVQAIDNTKQSDE